MGKWQKNWVRLGNGIELKRSQPTWDQQKNQQANLLEIKSGDVLSLKINKPERFLVAVDTGAKPRRLTTNNFGPMILATRVEWVYKYPTAYTIQCVCCDAASMEWYTAELTLGYIIPLQAELKLKALLTPPPALQPENDMEAALRKCFGKLNSGQIT